MSVAMMRPPLSLLIGFAILCAAPAAAPAAEFDGLKKTVAVETFSGAESYGGGVTADGLTAMLSTALANDGRFVVLERQGMTGIQNEQTMGQAGATTAETSPKAGQLIGASAIVRGAITKFEPAAGGGGLSVGALPIGGVFGQAGVSRKTSVLEISLRLIDTTTGQVISTSKAEGTASATGADISVLDTGSGAAIGGDLFKKTPIGEAAQDAMDKAVEQIAAGMRNVPWSALVVDASGGKVYLNAGANRNMQTGMQLAVYRKGKILTDPSTGEVLDVELSRIGSVRVDGVREKLSTATIQNGATPFRGDILKLE